GSSGGSGDTGDAIASGWASSVANSGAASNSTAYSGDTGSATNVVTVIAGGGGGGGGGTVTPDADASINSGFFQKVIQSNTCSGSTCTNSDTELLTVNGGHASAGGAADGGAGGGGGGGGVVAPEADAFLSTGAFEQFIQSNSCTGSTCTNNATGGLTVNSGDASATGEANGGAGGGVDVTTSPVAVSGPSGPALA